MPTVGGATRDTIWTGSAGKSFTSRAAPQVTGNFRPSVYGDDGIFWHAPGVAQDVMWREVVYGRATPGRRQSITANESGLTERRGTRAAG